MAAQDWRPTATRKMLELRASLLSRTRAFFASRSVLEVDTPLVVNAAVTDVHIHSARVLLDPPGPNTQATPLLGNSRAGSASNLYFLHTSPEYAMKRLLASGSGDIYQICHVVRGLERGRQHNTEFTLVEWYRVDFSLGALMSEVDALVRELLAGVAVAFPTERVSYSDVFRRELGLDPFTVSIDALAKAARHIGFVPESGGGSRRLRDELLELLMGTVIGPRLGRDALTFVYGYPASQAALARLDVADSRAAQRFELYCQGIELANGFHELASPAEQRARFQQDNLERRGLGMHEMALDERLLAALEAGLPDCSGVALGFDRTLMLASGAARIDEVLSFPTERA